MERRLIVMRHAKSAWPDGVIDHDRPLSGRGERDAAAAGHWLVDQGVEPDVALVSSSRRTRETIEHVAAPLGSSFELQVTDDLYMASAGDLLDAVRAVGDDPATVLLVAHNPGVGTLAALLDDGHSDVTRAAGYPTSATTVFQVPLPWDQLDPATARIEAFTVPRG